MSIGLLGGSFDPVHSGHLALARLARERVPLEQVIFLPTAQPPHKPNRQFAPAHARYAMVELALLREPGLSASSFELTIGRPSYTIDTVNHFRDRFPRSDLHLLIGADSFVELPAWRRWSELVERCRLVVLSRPGWEVGADGRGVPEELRALAAGDRVRFLDSPPVEASSTAIRDLLAAGQEPPAGWLPPLVLEYCQKYDLYR
ncbi:MAG: nicotinate-nucleotide adenylyltransferase [Thermoanaerobaculia bacterium]|nr:nicotinate-nucleotide adenylyltransferase [Thermoanaerobaculia bacterium]